MAASSVAGLADCLPLSPPLPPSPRRSDPPISPLPSNPPPTTTKEKRPPTIQHTELPTRKFGEEHEQKLELTPTGSQKPLDFLPPELLQALKQQQSRKVSFVPEVTASGGNKLPSSVSKWMPQHSPKKDNESGLPSVRPPANLWSYSKRRSRFMHLTAHPPCVCGAGSDISFLYDVPEDHKAADQKSTIPRTLIPEEYHIHKRAGVLGLDFHQDQYTTQSLAHNSHVTVFPSMQPGGRYEVMALKSTMDQMLEKAGVPQDESDPNLQGPTQIHNLLELVRKEQAIYNLCFHEIIRQVSVQCAERGELLQDIRSRYSQLLDRIPRQVMSLHNDVVAQRALYRRLTTEVKRFRSKVASITDRLGELKDHDSVVVEESKLAHKELSSALVESEKNANLLRECHGLYELQRNRLQESVDKLRWERDVWEGAAYGLAGQVSEMKQLRTLRRLQLGEKAWAMLVRHFTILLSDKDTQQLSEVDRYVGEWREGVMSVSGRLREMERDMRNRLVVVEDGMITWCEALKDIVAADGRVVPLGRNGMQNLWEELKAWLRVLNAESEAFSGEALLSRLESLRALSNLVEGWTEVALEVFSRHQEMNRFDHAPSDHTHSPEHQTMLSLNSDIGIAMKYCTARTTGDNGVAVGFIRLITPLETWDTKLNLCLSSNKTMPDSEWMKLRTLLGEWLDQVQKIRGYIGTVTSDTGSPLQCTPVNELAVKVEKWRSALTHSITTRNTKIDNMVTEMHSALVLWMVQLLLTSTHTPQKLVEKREGRQRGRGRKQEDGASGEKEGGEREREDEGEGKGEVEGDEGERGGVTEEDNWERGMGLTAVITVDLKTEYDTLADSLKRFTTSLTRCVSGVVEREADARREEGHPDWDREKRRLEQVGKEAGQWTQQAVLLLMEVAGDHGREERGGRRGEQTSETEEPGGGGDGGNGDGELPQEMFVIKEDLNIHSKPLQQVIDETPQPIPPTLSELGLLTEQDLPEGRGYLQKDTEALVLRLDHTQSNLEEQERLTRQEQERAEAAERELTSSRAQLSALEVELQQTRALLEQAQELATKSTARGGKGGGGKRGRGGGRPSSRK